MGHFQFCLCLGLFSWESTEILSVEQCLRWGASPSAWAGVFWGSKYPEEVGRHKDRKPRRDSQDTAVPCVTTSLQRPGQGAQGRWRKWNFHVHVTLGCGGHWVVTAPALRGSSCKGSHAHLECMTNFTWQNSPLVQNQNHKNPELPVCNGDS